MTPLLDPNSRASVAQQEAFEELHRQLGQGAGAAANVAAMAAEILDAGPA
jgi:hypothetical protein